MMMDMGLLREAQLHLIEGRRMSDCKKLKRFSETSRPEVGVRVLFSPGIILNVGIVQPYQPNHSNNKRCRVVGNDEHAVSVIFEGKKEIDLVSPDFLLPLELSKDENKIREELLLKGARV